MKLRDQMAMAALQSLVTGKNYFNAEAAKDAYALADAMLKERDKNNGELRGIKIAAENMVNNPESCSVAKSGELILGFLKGYGL